MSTIIDYKQYNLEAQIELMQEIINQQDNILFSIKQSGAVILAELSNKTENLTSNQTPKKTITISKEAYDRISDIGHHLQDESEYCKLGHLVVNSVNIIKNNNHLLKILRK